jgi:hypothetical protein
MGSTIPCYINNAFFNLWWIKPPPRLVDHKNMVKIIEINLLFTFPDSLSHKNSIS